jgi:DNA-binding transcriptional MocR family regulator
VPFRRVGAEFPPGGRHAPCPTLRSGAAEANWARKILSWLGYSRWASASVPSQAFAACWAQKRGISSIGYRQRLRRFAQERRDAIKAEITKLLTAGFIKEVFHPEWLANLVLV